VSLVIIITYHDEQIILLLVQKTPKKHVTYDGWNAEKTYFPDKDCNLSLVKAISLSFLIS